MAVGTETLVEAPAEEARYRMSAAQYFRAVEADVFPDKERVFLRNGQLYKKMSKKLPHSVAAGCVLAAVNSVIPPGWAIWPENPILTNEFSAPLPDYCVIRGHPMDYYRRGSNPAAGDIALVIEIAESSLRADRNAALIDYARAGLPVYWIVNLIDWQVEVYTRPETVGGTSRYASREDFRPGGDVPVTIDGVEVARVPAASILPGERRLDV